MTDWLVALFRNDGGTHASVFVLIIIVPVLLTAAVKKHAFEIGDVIVVSLSSAGFASGAKILVLVLCLDSDQLGPLSDDKPTLILGGIAALLVTAKETWVGSKKITGL